MKFVGLGFRTDRSTGDAVSPDSMFIVQVGAAHPVHWSVVSGVPRRGLINAPVPHPRHLIGTAPPRAVLASSAKARAGS